MRNVLRFVLIITTVVAAAWCVWTWHTKNTLTWEPILALLTAIGAALAAKRQAVTSPPLPTVSVSAPVNVPVNVPVNINVNSQPQAERKLPTQSDVDLFAELQDLLRYDPTILTIKDHDFGGPFRTQFLEPLFKFAHDWGDVSKEFLDPEVESARKSLHRAAHSLTTAIAIRTTREGGDEGFTTVFPENLRGNPRPQHVLDNARILNDEASAFMPHYETFVRTARARLGRPASS